MNVLLLISVLPVHCGRQCFCSYSLPLNYNIYNCSLSKLIDLPKADILLKNTDLLDLSRNKITKLCSKELYVTRIRGLDLSFNNISLVCDGFLQKLRKGRMETLNLVHNNITSLPSTITTIKTLHIVSLAGNKFACNCDMTWMIDWFKARTSGGERIVKDYDHILCDDGPMKRKEIYRLRPQDMGCYPHNLSFGEKLTIGIFGTLIIAIVIGIVAISRRWNEVKWFLYLHFDILDKGDKEENLMDKKYDVFLSYR